MIKVPNEDVLRAGVEHAEKDIKHWDQSSWADGFVVEDDKPACCTTACLAGHIMLASGTMTWKELLAYQEDWLKNYQDDPSIGDLALNLLGFPDKSEDDPKNWTEEIDARESFDCDVFEFVVDYQGHQSVRLERSQDRLDILKERITELTGIEF